MPTFWHKPAYTPEDRHPITREILPGALPPGIYCEDEGAFRALQRGARTRGATFDPAVPGGRAARLDGMAVYVATPEQAQLLQAVSSTEPPPPVSEPSYEETASELTRLQEKAARAVMLERWRSFMAGKPALTLAAPPPATRHPFRGANRAQRRAAEARRRRA